MLTLYNFLTVDILTCQTSVTNNINVGLWYCECWLTGTPKQNSTIINVIGYTLTLSCYDESECLLGEKSIDF